MGSYRMSSAWLLFFLYNMSWVHWIHLYSLTGHSFFKTYSHSSVPFGGKKKSQDLQAPNQHIVFWNVSLQTAKTNKKVLKKSKDSKQIQAKFELPSAPEKSFPSKKKKKIWGWEGEFLQMRNIAFKVSEDLGIPLLTALHSRLKSPTDFHFPERLVHRTIFWFLHANFTYIGGFEPLSVWWCLWILFQNNIFHA